MRNHSDFVHWSSLFDKETSLYKYKCDVYGKTPPGSLKICYWGVYYCDYEGHIMLSISMQIVLAVSAMSCIRSENYFYQCTATWSCFILAVMQKTSSYVSVYQHRLLQRLKDVWISRLYINLQ